MCIVSMDMRSADSKSGRCLTCLGCRRRGLSNKLTPFILQVLVVTLVWLLVKKSYNYTNNDTENPGTVLIRKIKSTDDQVILICNHAEFNQRDKLSIHDIISPVPNTDGKGFVLKVNILTRSLENEVSNFYAIDTPVNIEGLKQGEVRATTEKKVDKSEFYYDNAIEEKDLDEYSSSTVDADKDAHDEELGGNSIDGEESVENNADEEELFENSIDNGNVLEDSNQQPFNDMTNEKVTTMEDISNGVNPNLQIHQKENAVRSHELLESSNAQLGGQYKQTISNYNNAGVNQQNNADNRGLKSQYTQQVHSRNSMQPDRPVDLNIQFQPQQGQVGNRMFLKSQGVDLNGNQMLSAGLDVRQNRQGLRVDRMGQFNSGVQVSHGEQEQKMQSNMNSPSTKLNDQQAVVNMDSLNQPRIDSAQIENENNNVDSTQSVSVVPMNAIQDMTDEFGFKQRLTMFKTEYYGRSVEDSSEHRQPSYVINNPTLCEQFDKIDVLFLINTIPQSNEQRQRIRDTFVNRSLFQPFAIAHVFMVGQTNSPNFQGNLDREHEEYNDIVQGEFRDIPESRTSKGLMGFQWVTTFCPNVKFVMKINEDVFVDTDKLLQGLIPAALNHIGERVLLCYLVQNAPIPRSGPNAFNQNLFPKSSRMRPYCKGFAVLTTVNTLSAIVTASEHVPIFQFDELYLFGILPFVAGGVEAYDLGNKRAFHDFGMAVVNCYKDLQDKCPFVATKAFSSRFTSLWEYVATRKKPESPPFQADPSLWNLEEIRTYL